MKIWAQSPRFAITLLGAFAATLVVVGSGCQVEMGGQTLPSPYYMQDDVQYFAPGPEFRLAREAAALKEARGEVIPTPAPAGEGGGQAAPGGAQPVPGGAQGAPQPMPGGAVPPAQEPGAVPGPMP